MSSFMRAVCFFSWSALPVKMTDGSAESDAARSVTRWKERSCRSNSVLAASARWLGERFVTNGFADTTGPWYEMAELASKSAKRKTYARFVRWSVRTP